MLATNVARQAGRQAGSQAGRRQLTLGLHQLVSPYNPVGLNVYIFDGNVVLLSVAWWSLGLPMVVAIGNRRGLHGADTQVALNPYMWKVQDLVCFSMISTPP